MPAIVNAAVVTGNARSGPESFEKLTNTRGKQLNRERVAVLHGLFRQVKETEQAIIKQTSRVRLPDDDMMTDEQLSLRDLRILWKLMFPELMMDRQMAQTERTFNIIDSDRSGHVSWNELLDYFAACEKGSEDMEVVDLFFEDRIVQTRERPGSPREWVWSLMEQSSADTYALAWIPRVCMAVQLTMQLVILTSVVIMMVESLEVLVKQNCDWDKCTVDEWNSTICDLCEGGGPGTVTFTLEAVCIALFTIEFVLRFGSTPSQHDYWTSVWTYIDLISILPFYLDASQAVPTGSASSLVVLRMLRMVKLARVMKMLRLGKNFRAIQVMFVALARAKMALVMMCALMLMTIVFYSALMYNVEKVDSYFNHSIPPHGKWVRKQDASWSLRTGEALFFQSIPATMWWGLATVTTVGYGDVYPESPLGKFVAGLCMVTGILVVAYPITILTNAFAVVDGEFQDEETRKKLRDGLDKRLAAAAADCPRWYIKASREILDAEARAPTPRALRTLEAAKRSASPIKPKHDTPAVRQRRKSESRYSFASAGDSPPVSPKAAGADYAAHAKVPAPAAPPPLRPKAGWAGGAHPDAGAPQEEGEEGDGEPPEPGGEAPPALMPDPSVPPPATAEVQVELLRRVQALEEGQRAILRSLDELLQQGLQHTSPHHPPAPEAGGADGAPPADPPPAAPPPDAAATAPDAQPPPPGA